MCLMEEMKTRTRTRTRGWSQSHSHHLLQHSNHIWVRSSVSKIHVQMPSEYQLRRNGSSYLPNPESSGAIHTIGIAQDRIHVVKSAMEMSNSCVNK